MKEINLDESTLFRRYLPNSLSQMESSTNSKLFDLELSELSYVYLFFSNS